MAWEVVKREDTFEGSDRPFISISASHISFNAMFTRIAKIDGSYRVVIFSDPDSLRLGFEFSKEEVQNSLALSQTKGRPGLFCAAIGLVNKYKWVKSITKLQAKDRRFYDPKQESGKWVIQLCPAFEERNARDSSKIPADATGIYRYIRENGEIVYIGRGNIKNRLSSPERNDWDFDVIEYSKIKDPDQQVYWEDYWIEKFKDANDRLPFYNKIAGFS